MMDLNDTPIPTSPFGPVNLHARTRFLLQGGSPRDEQDSAILGRLSAFQRQERNDALIALGEKLVGQLQATNDELATLIEEAR